MSANDRGEEPIDDLLAPSAAREARPKPPSRGNGAPDPRDERVGSRPSPRVKPANPSRPGEPRAAVAPSSRSGSATTLVSDDRPDVPARTSSNGAGPSADVLVDASSARLVEPPTEATIVVPQRPNERRSERKARNAAARAVVVPAVVPATDFPPTSYAPAPIDHLLAPPPPRPTTVYDDDQSLGAYPHTDSGSQPVTATRRPVRLVQGGRRRRPRVRRVTRVIRHVDPWSVFKVALCFSFVLYGVCLTAGVLLWNVAYTTGTVDNMERFFESFGWESFEFKGGELFHNAWIGGLFIAIGLTGLIVLAATLFNLITDLVGGVRVTVLEEEVVERNPSSSTAVFSRRTGQIRRVNEQFDRDTTGGYERP